MAFLQRNFFILLIFFSFVPIIWPTGIFQESDWAIFGLWFIAGFYALIFPREVKISPLALGFLFLAAFSLFGVLQNNLTSIGGINEIREGTATSLALAILIVVGRQANMQSLPLWIAPILYGLITVAGCHGLLHLKTYIFLDISAFPMLASIPLYVKFRQSLLRFQYLWDSTYVIAFLFLLKSVSVS